MPNSTLRTRLPQKFKMPGMQFFEIKPHCSHSMKFPIIGIIFILLLIIRLDTIQWVEVY